MNSRWKLLVLQRYPLSRLPILIKFSLLLPYLLIVWIFAWPAQANKLNHIVLKKSSSTLGTIKDFIKIFFNVHSLYCFLDNFHRSVSSTHIFDHEIVVNICNKEGSFSEMPKLQLASNERKIAQ